MVKLAHGHIIMSGTGSAVVVVSVTTTHVQVGVDKNMSWTDWICFTGFTVTHTDSSASADAFKGKTKSVGPDSMLLPCLIPVPIST